MTNNNRKRRPNKGMSRDMYNHIISNVHRFKSIDIEKGIIETARGTNGHVCSSTGYVRAKLGDKNVQVHSVLVALTYGEESIGKQVNHKNGIKTDNRKENLEIVTQQENIKHQWETGLSKGSMGENNPNALLTNEEVRTIREEHTPFKKRGNGTPKYLAKKFNVPVHVINNVVSQKDYGTYQSIK